MSGRPASLTPGGGILNTLERSHLLAVCLDLRGTVSWCNDHFLLHTGWKRREVVGFDWFDRFLLPGMAARLRDVLSGGAAPPSGSHSGCFPTHVECPVLARDGSPRVVAWNHLVAYDGEGRAEGTILLGEDMTEQRRAEGALSREDRHNRVLLDNLPAPALLLQAGTYLIVASNRAAQREGARAGETCFRSWRGREEPCPWCLSPALWGSGKTQELAVEVNGRVLDTRWVPEEGGLLLHYAFDVTESLRMAESLHRSEERYRRLFADAPVPMMEADASGMRRILAELSEECGGRLAEHLGTRPLEVARCLAATRVLAANRETVRLYEADGEDALLHDLGHLCTDGSYGPISEAMGAAAAGKLSLHFESPTRLPGGRIRIVNVWVSIPPGYEESWSRIILTLQDITAQRETEKSLRESERLFRDTFDHSGTAIVHVAPGGAFLAVNPRYCEMVGYGRDELLGTSFLDITHPADRGADKEAYRLLSAGSASTVSSEKRYVRKDGTVVWAHRIVGTVRDAEGGVRYFVVVVEDISERKRMEEALRESETRFRSLVEATSDWIWRIDPAGRYTYSSPKVGDLLGYEPEEILGKTPFQLMAPEDRKRVRPEFRRVIAAREPIRSLENVNLHRDGRRVVLETNGVPIFDGTGAFLGYQGVDRDIGERKRVEEELTRTGEELRRLSAHLRTAVEEERRRISREIHDILGQGLIGLRLDTSWLSEGLLPSQGELAERTGDMVRTIDDTIQTVKRIAGELRPPLLDDLGLGAAIEWQAKEFQKRSGIPCRVTLVPKEIQACPEGSTAIFRIFQETLSNVVQHAGATLVRVRLVKEEGSVALTVRDNGVGIPMEKVRHSRSLGLLGMRERAYLLGGTVAVRGTENRGTVVTVRIPLRPPVRTGGTGTEGTEDP